MNSISLRQIIKESIQEYIREVETSGNVAAQEAKIRACDEAIALREKKLNMEGLDEAYHDMIDEAKKKNLEKEIKELQKYKKKAEKILEKMKSKAGKEDTMENEGMGEEAVIDEVAIDEMDPEAGPQLEEAKKKKAAKKEKEEKEMMNESFLYMQKLAGVITEAEYKQKKSLIKEEENISPEQTAKEVSQHIDSLESDPNLKSIADKIANDPKATEELNKMLAKFDISLNEGNVDINPQDAYKMALVFAKKAKTMNEGVGGAFWTGLLGGGLLAKYIASAGDVITPHMKLMGYEPSHMGAMAIGSIAGAALLVIAKMVYDKLKK
jgi:hypothetical protein